MTVTDARGTLDALAAYVKSLPNGPAPFLNQDGMLGDNAQDDAKRGFALFSEKAGCMTCHLPVSYDKKGPEDVGSGGPEESKPRAAAVAVAAPRPAR